MDETGTSASAPGLSASASRSVDPARVKRIRAELPDGYEVADATDVMTPAAYWGLRTGWTAEPPQCAALANPVDDGAAQGLSGSGGGGLLHVVVATAPAAPVTLDPVLLAECGRWTAMSGRSTASVTVGPGPPIDGVDTVEMDTAIQTVVESGTETDSQAHTFTAYPDGQFVFVTLVVDPGSPHSPLPAQYAAELLVKTVAALRGP